MNITKKHKIYMLLSMVLTLSLLIGSISNEYSISIYQSKFFKKYHNWDEGPKIGMIYLSYKSELNLLIKLDIDIINVEDLKVITYLNSQQIEKLSKIGLKYEIIYENIAEYHGWIKNPKLLYQFHDYYSLTTELQDIATTYPDITNLYELGQSVQGLSIWGLKITDNPDIEENEAEVRICGVHHGDELMSLELPLLLAWHLVENYSINPDITNLIDNREIWIIPLVNPDGRMSSPPQRRNANNVDLNRDYGYMWDGSGGSPGPFSQPETQTIREHALENNFVLSLSYHTTAAYVNYIWNYKPQPAPDDDVIVYLSNQYAASSGYTAIRGYDWYQTRGDTNDFSYGCCGDLDWTIETGNSNIGYTWNKNRDAMIDIIESADMGLTGIVTDANTGQPINATIWVEEANWPCFTDPILGDYHKPLLPGNYNVHIKANGYQEEMYNNIQVTAGTPTVLDVVLTPGGNYYAYQVTLCNYYDPYYYPNNFQNNPTEGVSALGPPDNIYASLGVGGTIVLDMGHEGEIKNNLGNDFKIFEGDTTPDGYYVYVSEEWNGPWIYIGEGTGTTGFDLDDIEMNKARYVKIEDDSDGSPYETNPGFDLDAIQSLNVSIINIYYVDDDYDSSTPGWQIDHFNNIQDGIDAAIDDSIISVYNGIYNENILINKTIHLIGQNNENTMINGGNTDDTIHITSNNVEVKGFKIQNSGNNGNPHYDAGIDIRSNFNEINNNIISSNNYGIILIQSDSNTIINNEISYNNNGIFLQLFSDNNVVYCNNIIDNTQNAYDSCTNAWNHPFIQKGNYWSDYTGSDGDGDGIGDTSYQIQGGTNEDLYPVMQPFLFNALLNGWNLVTITVENNYMASDITGFIPGSLSMSKWDAQNQTYYTYIVGGPPSFDFPIRNGYGYFIDMSEDNILAVSGEQITSISIPLKIGWNLIGWYHDYETTSSNLASAISGCQSVSKWDAQNQTYYTYIVGGPPSFDFAIKQGMGLFVDVSVPSTWQGEG